MGQLLHEERVCDVQLPRVQKIAVLEDDLLDEASSSSDEEMPEIKSGKPRERSRSHGRNRDRERERRRHRSRSRERRREGRDRSPRGEVRESRDSRDYKKRDEVRVKREREDRGERGGERGGTGGGKDNLSVDETNKLRESLGLAPLK